ncbi:hypothetical protein [Chryseobacterium sp. EO14]|uniref:hypothetical protein n=1 Tax=Chryseobacterium sp. EO14 TaxID=2950551 RepID=UPI00210DD461|nr:hypothetical protein [Chryseobacterium sp. EO14]MCQ4140603.1 hypothetical protein [Chryseobacterium sp. EO14]
MKNVFQKESIDSLVSDLDFAHNNKHRMEDLIANFSKLKPNVPFSPRLNDWITNWYEQHKEIFIFTDYDDFDGKDIKGTLQRHVDRFKTTGKIHIWKGASNDTIFSEPEKNHFFRAVHEFCHISNGLGFDFIGESIVCALQIGMLPNDWIFEKQLIVTEIIGQNQYFSIHKEFVRDQRLFSIQYLQNPYKAIFTKQ